MVAGLLAVYAILFQQAAPDSTVVLESARRAEAAYERAARRYAPFAGWTGGSDECDEVVGRFCLRFDDHTPGEPPPEPASITDARRAAIDSLRRAFNLLPAELAVSGPLVRLLLEDERPSEAVAVALTFGTRTTDSVSGPLLEGFALHATGADSAAALWFEAALRRMDAEEAARVRSPEWLLTRGERRRYRALAGAQRLAYETKFWRLSDPLAMTAANELWTEHVARYAYARLLERRPVVTGVQRWGKDLEELTIRYGVPQRRGRLSGARFGESGIVEYYDPDQLAYAAPDLMTNGVTRVPEPGSAWPLREPRARSGHSPASIRNMDSLPHQASRIPVAGQWIVRVDGAFGLDSLARAAPEPLPGDTARPAAPVPRHVDAGVWLFDAANLGAITAAVPHAVERLQLDGDSARIALSTRADPGSYVYSFEAFEPATRTARRARYALEIDSIAGLRISDVIIARPFDDALPDSYDDERLVPRAHLVLPAGSRAGVFAQTHGAPPGTYRIEVSIENAERASLPARVVGWIGRTLGLSSEAVPPRVAWDVAHTGTAPLVVALDLTIADNLSGLQRIEVAVVHVDTGTRALAERLVRIESDRIEPGRIEPDGG